MTDKKTLSVKKPRRSSKKLFGHDNEINRAMVEKKGIVIVLLSGLKFAGLVVDFDKYTITVSLIAGAEDGCDSTVIYKHAIETFSVRK